MAGNLCSIATHSPQPDCSGPPLNFAASNSVGAIISAQRHAVASCEGGGYILPMREAHNG
jgi:hypothetical protein